MLFDRPNHSGFIMIFILSFSLILVFFPSIEGGYVWEEEELGALKYDHKYPFVVLKKNVILYSSKEDGGDHFDIWRMALDGSDHLQLTDNDIDEIKPTSDDDGMKIVFTGEKDIFIMDFDGSDHSNIIQDVGDGFTLMDATISANGNWVSFSSNMDNDTDKNWGDYNYFTSIPMDIWKCETDGDNADQLTDQNWDEYSPAFSPDVGQIVFVAEESAGDEDIHLMDSDGGNWERLVTWQSKDDSYPSYSSNGRFVIYSEGSDSDKFATMYDIEAGVSYYISAETIDEDGDKVVEKIKGRYFRFYPPTDNVDELKVIYSASSGTYSPKLSIWTSEKAKISYTVNIGPIEREAGNYRSEPIEGVSVKFTYGEVEYENLTDENGWASFILPVGKLSYVEINATVGDEWVTWISNNYPPEFSSDLVQIGPIKLHTEKTEYWGLPLQGVLVSFAYKGITYENTTDEEGNAHFRLVIDGERVDLLPSGTIINATWDGETQTWEDGEDEAEFHRYMIGLGPIVLKTDSSGYSGKPVQGAKIGFSFEGDDYENITDEDGYAKFGPFTMDELPSGTLINVTYGEEWIGWEQGDYNIPNFASYSVSIGPINRLTDEWDYSGTAVKGAMVSFEYKGKRYENITDLDGKAHFTLDVKKLPTGIEFKAKKGGDTISWEQDDPLPKFSYESTTSDWFQEYIGVFIVGCIFFVAIIARIIQRVAVKKKGRVGVRDKGRQNREVMSEKAFDTGKSSAAKGNDLFKRKMYPQALDQYRIAQQYFEQALQLARIEKDEALKNSIEGMLRTIRDNAVSAEMAMDEKIVQDGYQSAEKNFNAALKLLRSDNIFEARRDLMEISRELERLSTVAKSRNFTQAMKKITTFQVRVRENINVADLKMSEGIDSVSFSGGSIEAGSVMSMDVTLSSSTVYEGGYVVEELTLVNNLLFDVTSAELKVSLDSNVLHLSHTYPTYPTSETSVSMGVIAKGVGKKVKLFFDPLVSTSTYLDISLIYVDSSGKYRTSPLGRRNIEIRPPEIIGDRNINIATLKDIIISQAKFQDSRVYGIDPKVPLKDVLSLAKEGMHETNFSKVRDTNSHDMASSWFYAVSGDGRDKIIIRASVINSSRVLEIFAACSKKEHLTTVLADISQRVTAKLSKRWRQLQPVTQVNVEIKDSIIQRSNLDFSGMAGNVPGNINISDSVLTRSTVGAPGGSGAETNLGAYRNLLIMVLQDGIIDANEEQMLAKQRNKMGISIEQHYELLSGLNR